MESPNKGQFGGQSLILSRSPGPRKCLHKQFIQLHTTGEPPYNETFGTAIFFHYSEVFFIERYKLVHRFFSS